MKKKKKSDKKKKAPTKAPGKKNPGSENLMAPWKPGQSGNPKGSQKGPRLTTLLKERLQAKETKSGRTFESLFIEAGVRQACKGNAPIFREIWNRVEGKVADNLNVRGVNPIADALSEMDDKKLGKHIKELEKWRKNLN